jgi:hypothetical protein
MTIAPMAALLRLQSRLIRAIEPGLAHADPDGGGFVKPRGMDEASARFVFDFVPENTLPTFEPYAAAGEFIAVRLRPTGITLYQLGRHGAPEAMLGHWAYGQDGGKMLHLQSAR